MFLQNNFWTVKTWLVSIQETLCLAEKSCDIFHKLFVGWECSVMDSMVHYGGLFVSCNPLVSDLSPFLSIVGILLEGRLRGIKEEEDILNYYGTYANRHVFWEVVGRSGISKALILFVGRDLNLTLGVNEVWGSTVRINSLIEYFVQFF